MNRERLDTMCEHGVLALVLGILVFGPLALGAVRTPEFLVIQGLALGVLLLWSVRLWLSPRPRLLWPPICWAVLVFIGYAVVRYLTADIEYVARVELIRLLVYAAVFFAILNNLHRANATQIIVFTLIFLAMAISAYAIYQFITGSNKVWHFISPYKHRAGGTYINPNHLAGFLEMLLPLALAYVLAGKQKPLTKVFLGYATLLMLFGLAVTVSRGSWVAAGIALVMLFGLLAWKRNYRVPALVLLVGLIGACIYFMPKSYFFQERVRRLFAQVSDMQTDTRYELWHATVQMWKDNFWWGVGPGHFDYCFRQYRPESIQARPDRAHNEYLNTLADWGLIGAVLLGAVWALLWAGVARSWKYVQRGSWEFGQRPSNRFAFVVGASSGLVALLLHSFVDFNMHIPANAILAVSLMGLLTGHLRFATDRYWVWVRLPGKAALTVVLAAGIAYLGWQLWRGTAEYTWLGRAAQAPIFSRAQVAALERAFKIEPMNAETAHNIGEAYRVQSWQGNDDYEQLAYKAMDWFARAMRLNPHDPYNYLRYGMCLDWIGKTGESEPYFERAAKLDPNGYFTLAHIGWHHVQRGNYAAAMPWLERSRRLQWRDNLVAISYLEIVKRKLAEQAAANTPIEAASPAK